MGLTIGDKRVSARCQLSYHRAHLRKLYLEAFTTQELQEYVYDHPGFHDLAKQLPEPVSHSQIVLALLQYAERRLLIEELLSWARQRRRALYEQYRPYFQQGKLTVNASLTISGSDAELSALSVDPLKRRWSRALQKRRNGRWGEHCTKWNKPPARDGYG